MNIAFAGFKHSHVNVIYRWAEKHPDLNIIGCWEDEESYRKDAEEAVGAVFNYDKFNDMISDSNVDIIVSGNYYGIRGQMVIHALKKGKHIISDKPLCTSLEELQEIEQLAKDNNLKIGLMLDLREMSAARELKYLLESGKLGKVHSVSFGGQHPLNYGSRPSWYFEKGKHGGTINDIAIHGIDLVEYITGKRLTKINCAKSWNAFAKEEPEFLDCAQFMAELEDNISVMADVSYSLPVGCKSKPIQSWRFTFWCDNGIAEFAGYNDTLYLTMTSCEEIKEIKSELPKISILDCFIDDVLGKNTGFNTKVVINSSHDALLLQKVADLYNK